VQGSALDGYRLEANLSHYDLWLRYFQLGGMNAQLGLEALLSGALIQTSEHDHDVIAHALNERFVELGAHSRVPYCADCTEQPRPARQHRGMLGHALQRWFAGVS
jgi:hypothetical protein